jgi:hypothetical protein
MVAWWVNTAVHLLYEETALTVDRVAWWVNTVVLPMVEYAETALT